MGQIQVKDVSPQQFNLEYNGVLIGTLTRKGLTALLGQAKPTSKAVRQKRKKFVSQSDVQAEELLVKANQLGKAYRVARSKWHSGHGRKMSVARNCAFAASELSALKKAVVIMQANEVSNYQTFIKAQVAGLRFCNGGKGVFPKIQQLATDTAEHRLLEYLKSEKDENGDVIDVDVSADERATPLTENMKYMSLRDLILEGKATRSEALYVMTLQVHRTGKVKPYVTEYLDQLNQVEVQ